ncbi:MAG: (d)CMP kinase [Mariniblastus sp.]
METMIVTIDGPAGAGKSTVTRLLAKELDFEFLDTGAMYRAVTWCAMHRGIDLKDQSALSLLAQEIQIEFDDDQVIVNGENVSQKIRQNEITRNVVAIADAPAVREHLVNLQRRIAATGNFVCEGRDQGTVAFPDAFCKIFLTASSQSRAHRRVEQMQSAGEFVDFDQVIREQDVRDEQDSNRKVGRLMKADDAVEVNTDHQTLPEVVENLEAIVRERMAANQT